MSNLRMALSAREGPEGVNGMMHTWPNKKKKEQEKRKGKGKGKENYLRINNMNDFCVR